jgi:hypothetical protein
MHKSSETFVWSSYTQLGREICPITHNHMLNSTLIILVRAVHHFKTDVKKIAETDNKNNDVTKFHVKKHDCNDHNDSNVK